MSVNYNARLHRTTGNFVVSTMLSIRRLFIRWTPRYSTDITRRYFKKKFTTKKYLNNLSSDGSTADEASKDQIQTFLDLVYAGNLTQIQNILDAGNVDVNAKGTTGTTALHQAALEGHFEVVQFLVQE